MQTDHRPVRHPAKRHVSTWVRLPTESQKSQVDTDFEALIQTDQSGQPALFVSVENIGNHFPLPFWLLFPDHYVLAGLADKFALRVCGLQFEGPNVISNIAVLRNFDFGRSETESESRQRHQMR